MQVLETLQRAAQIVEQIKDKSRLAEIYAGIGTIYRYLNQSSEAIAYYHRAMSIWEELQDFQNLAEINSNISLVYYAQARYE